MLLRMFRKKKMDETALKERVATTLQSNRIMTLACSDDGGLWTAPVFYSQNEYNLIWVSSPNSRHSKAFKNDPEAAASIYNSKSEWQRIQGLQISGRVDCPQDEEEIKELRRFYTRKFPFTGAFFSQKGMLPEPIKSKVEDVQFYRLVPNRIRLVDNSVRFGFNFEFNPAE